MTMIRSRTLVIELAARKGPLGPYENLLAHTLQRAADKGWLTTGRQLGPSFREIIRDGGRAKDGRPSKTLPAEQLLHPHNGDAQSPIGVVGQPKDKTEAAVAGTARLYGVESLERISSDVVGQRSPARRLLDRWRLDPETVSGKLPRRS